MPGKYMCLHNVMKITVTRFVIGTLLFYICTYFIASRIGFRESDSCNIKGFYFCSNNFLLNDFCVVIYHPLIKIDCWIGTGKSPASRPMEGLDK